MKETVMQSQAMDRLKKARAKMLVKHPFFATLMMSMPMIETREIETAATDMKTLYINPDFIETIDDDVLMFVIAHEIMHTALTHGLRRGERVPLRWNVATDYAINLILRESKFKIWEHALIDDEWKDMSADAIYNALTKEEDEQKKSGGQGQPQQGQGQGQPGAGGAPPPPGAQDPSQTGAPGNQHHSPMLGDLMAPPCEGDHAAEDRMRKDIQQRVAQAASIARMTGNLPGSIERFVEQVLEPKVPWEETLRHLMTEFDKSDEDWMHRNRRFSTYLPTDHSESRLGEFIVIGDTSGSIGDEEMAGYIAECRAVIEDCKPERTRLIWADTEVAGEQEFEAGDELLPRPMGGGGTDMRVPLKYVEEYDPTFVVLFTDGHTPWPKEEPPYPLIVCCTTEVNVPVGEVLRI
jgi:predicted metal-dependent peptidase